jgi:hypothetical protein
MRDSGRVKRVLAVSFLALMQAGCGGESAASPRRGLPLGGQPAPSTREAAGVGEVEMGGGLLPPPPPLPAPMPENSCNQDVDVVFSLDVSGSMTPSLTKLAAEIGAVDAALKTKNLPSPPHYGLVLFCDDFKVMNMGQPYTDIEAVKTEVTKQATLAMGDAGRQVDPNTDSNDTWPENSLDSLHAAATEFAWRPDDKTLRIIFHITDASFWDGAAPSSGAMSEQQNTFFGMLVDTPVESMHSYAQTIAALQMAHVWVNTFAAKTGGPPDGRMAPPSHGGSRGISVNVGVGFFEPYMAMKSIPDVTGGSAWDLDEVYDGKVSLGQPILTSIEARQCARYPEPD